MIPRARFRLIPIRPELTPELLALSARAEAVLGRYLPANADAPVDLHAAMRYSVLGGGKRLRPLLVYATAKTLGGRLDSADASAAAVEIIHAYSLIHDDLPAMDDDDLRRGQPTCHIAFGEAMAILAGDALQALAFEILAAADTAGPTPLQRLAIMSLLAHACGALGMAGGQALDLEAVGQRLTAPALERMHALKTGALIRAAVGMGARSAECQDAHLLERLDQVASRVGLAFQIRDDILDVEGDTAIIGKRQGADQAHDKPTYPAILGMSASRLLAARLRAEAIDLLHEFGDAALPLRDLAHYAVDRQS